MKNTVMKSAGPCTKFTISQTTSRPTRIVASVGRMYELAGRRRSLIGSRVASVAISRFAAAPGSDCPAPPFLFSFSFLRRQVVRGGERLDRVERIRLLLVDRDRRQIRVALVVDRERPQDPVRDLQPEQLIRDRRARAV